jgi:hypothetical protein
MVEPSMWACVAPLTTFAPKEQFEFCPKNVNFEEMQEALNEYVKYGAYFSKSRVCFTHTNILHY